MSTKSRKMTRLVMGAYILVGTPDVIISTIGTAAQQIT